MPEKMRTECCICRDWKDEKTPTWYTPKSQERRAYHFSEHNKISHGYCPTCYLSQMTKDGFTKSQIESILQEIS